MLSWYRKSDDWNTDEFLMGIAANLSDYPRDVIDEVCHPAKGIASRNKFPPNPSEVRDACEKIMGPRRIKAADQARRQAQLEERRQIEETPRIQQTPEEVKAEMIARGFNWGGRKAQGIETPESVRAKFGLTQEQWDALPNGPKSSWQKLSEAAPANYTQDSTGPPDRVEGTLCTGDDMDVAARG